jgi:hypothetical protein
MDSKKPEVIAALPAKVWVHQASIQKSTTVHCLTQNAKVCQSLLYVLGTYEKLTTSVGQ